jgi:hypothetical protein
MDRPENLSLRDKIEWIIKELRKLKRGGGGSSLALGETESTAYRGDRGKIAYDHSQITGNPHGTTKADIGLGNVNNTSDLDKPISNATQTALDLKADLSVINNLQIGGRNLITKLHKEKSYPAIGFWEYFPLSEKLKEGETYILNGTVENVGGAISIGLNNFEGYNVYVITLPINTPFVANNEMANRTHFSIANQTGVGTSIFKSFKLEKGNKATDWTPAPEDKQDRLQDITGYIGVGKTDASATELVVRPYQYLAVFAKFLVLETLSTADKIDSPERNAFVNS